MSEHVSRKLSFLGLFPVQNWLIGLLVNVASRFQPRLFAGNRTC